EGRISAEQMHNFRTETERGKGLSSYPHAWLMPDYWQFANVSMGLGPIMAIYQARLMKYLQNRGLKPTEGRKVWCFCGDGEMDEPESLGAIDIAARERLDNLIFVVNCNLQRLDGPVRGNGKIIKELEGDQGDLALGLGRTDRAGSQRHPAAHLRRNRRWRVAELQGQGRQVHARE